MIYNENIRPIYREWKNLSIQIHNLHDPCMNANRSKALFYNYRCLQSYLLVMRRLKHNSFSFWEVQRPNPAHQPYYLIVTMHWTLVIYLRWYSKIMWQQAVCSCTWVKFSSNIENWWFWSSIQIELAKALKKHKALASKTSYSPSLRAFYVPREAFCKHRIKVACLSNWCDAKQNM